MENNKKEETALFIQVVLAFVTFFLAIISIFVPDMLVVTQLFIALLLFDMAYNNHLLYHRLWVTPIYIATGIFMLFLFGGLVMQIG